MGHCSTGERPEETSAPNNMGLEHMGSKPYHLPMAFDLAAHIKQTRKSLGLTQDELAEQAGIDQGDLSRIERGEIDPRWSTVQKLSAALGEIVAPMSTTTRRPLSPGSRAAVRGRAGRLKRDAVPLIPVKR